MKAKNIRLYVAKGDEENGFGTTYVVAEVKGVLRFWRNPSSFKEDYALSLEEYEGDMEGFGLSLPQTDEYSVFRRFAGTGSDDFRYFAVEDEGFEWSEDGDALYSTTTCGARKTLPVAAIEEAVKRAYNEAESTEY
mgnify:CR=1 FL=1